MIFSTKKFNTEIRVLKNMRVSADSLSPGELSVIREKILLRLSRQPAIFSGFSWSDRIHNLTRYVISILVGLSVVAGTTFASNAAVPGDLLYPIKRAKEKVELSLSVSEESKANLQAGFAKVRLQELHALSAKIKANKENEGHFNLATSTEIFVNISTTSAGSIISNINIHSGATTTNGEKGLKKLLKKVQSKDEQLEAGAALEAQAEVNDALIHLKRTKDKLRARGNNRAADLIEKNILNLRAQAEAEKINTWDLNVQNSDNNNSSIKIDDAGARIWVNNNIRATSTGVSSHIKVHVESHGNSSMRVDDEKIINTESHSSSVINGD